MHLVKSQFEELNSSFNDFQAAHEALVEHLTSDEDKDKEDDYFTAKQSTALEFRNQIIQWIELGEARLAERADLLERNSMSSKGSKRSRHSRRSTGSVASAREKERVKLAEMMAEKSLLRERQRIEELRLEIDIAKSRARERVYTMMEAEEYGGLPTYFNSAPPLMRSTPRQRSNFSVITEQYEGNGSKCPDAITERNEHRSTEEGITTEIHAASKEPNEQYPSAPTLQRNATSIATQKGSERKSMPL